MPVKKYEEYLCLNCQKLIKRTAISLRDNSPETIFELEDYIYVEGLNDVHSSHAGYELSIEDEYFCCWDCLQKYVFNKNIGAGGLGAGG